MNRLLALFFYRLGDLSWAIVRATDWNFITRRLISNPAWALYQKSMSLSLDYDEKCGYFIWKLPENNE
jgi:hypothetical protein